MTTATYETTVLPVEKKKISAKKEKKNQCRCKNIYACCKNIGVILKSDIGAWDGSLLSF